MTSEPRRPTARGWRSIPKPMSFLSVALLLVVIATGTGVAVFTAPNAVADASLTIDRVTTVRANERVDGVVEGQPVEIHLQYTELGDGVHTVRIRDSRSGEHILDTTVIGDSGTERIGVDGAALADAYAANASVIALEATTSTVTSATYVLEKVDRATMYLTAVPDETGRNDSVTVSYYGWTRASVDVRLFVDALPRGSNDGEDVLIDETRIEPPSGVSLPYEFEGTFQLTPSRYLASSTADEVVIQVRQAARWAPETFWGNSERIEITNHRPVADFDYSPTRPRVNRSVTFNASASTDIDGRIVRYEWDFDGDGRIDTTGRTVTRTFATGGDRTVSLTVTDDAGATSTLRTRLTVIAPPQPVVTYSPTDPVTTQRITFDASGSNDPDGTIERYEWDFENDGTTDAVGPVVTHAYSIDGRYLVSLRVIDDDGASDIIRRAITVAPLVRPTANLAYRPHIPTVNQSVAFDASDSIDPDGRIVRYEWDFGDGASTNTTSPVVRHPYTEGGTYQVTLTLVDDDRASDTTRIQVRVNEPPAVHLTVSNTSPMRDQPVAFNASGSSDSDGRIVRYEWEFGDGASANTDEAVAQHAYSNFGTYTVIVTAIDNDGATRSRQTTITVENRAPNAVFRHQPFRPKVGNGIRFDASRSGDVDGRIEHYRWDFDGDGTPEASDGPIATHTYQRRGTYTVTLIVEDDAGATNVTTRTIRVVPTLPLLELVLLTVLILWAIGVFWLSGMLSFSRPEFDFGRFDFRRRDDVPDEDDDVDDHE